MKKLLLFAVLLMHGTPSFLVGQSFLDSVSINRLYYTCKVWGFLKYFHSSAARRTNWDAALLDAVPRVTNAQSKQEFNSALSLMISLAGSMAVPTSPPSYVPDSLRYNLNLSWLTDTVFSADVRATLDTVRNWFRPQDNYYVGGFPYPAFDRDKLFYQLGDTLLSAQELRLLSLFRYWNIINYFFPYKNVLDQTWDDALKEFIPKFWRAGNNVSYHLTVMELAARINDGHAFTQSVIIDMQIRGTYSLPLRLKYIGNETVVRKVFGDTSRIKAGDIIREINGVDIQGVRDSLRPYAHGSNTGSVERTINALILAGRKSETVKLLLNGPGGLKEVGVTRELTDSAYSNLLLATGPVWRRLRSPDSARAYGYVDMARLIVGDVARMFSELWDTDGIIFDCRNSSGDAVGEVARYLFSSSLYVAQLRVPDIRYPGTLELMSSIIVSSNLPNLYRKGIMILLDEETTSQAEYTAMGLEQHHPSLKIGSQTAGSNGNVLASVYLPGGITTSYSDIGYFYPDGRPTQRIGIVPDIGVDPTVEGIRQGRDEVLEAALRQVLQPPDTLTPTEWSWQPPFPQWNDLRAVYAINADIIFAVGDLGTIVKTTDGGRTWVRQVSGTSNHLRGVWFTNGITGVAVGDQGTNLRTTDGGNTWTVQTVNDGVTFYGVCFPDARTGIAVGYPSAIYRTTDGGNTWVSQLSGPAVSFRGVCFSDANTGTVVGSSGTIFRTTNGGVKWNRQLSGFEGTDTLLSGVSFTDALTGTVVGRSGVILRTANGGISWTLQQSGTVRHLYAITFVDASTGIVAGDVGTILRTTNGGTAWTALSSDITDWFSGASFTSASTGTVVGSYGTILHTTDGGLSWNLQTRGPRLSLYAVRFTDAITGTIVGYRGAIFRTTDGGATWVTQSSGTKEFLRGITFADANTGIAVGDLGTIIRTTDGGTTWIDQSIKTGSGTIYSFSGVSFGSRSTGLIVGARDSSIVDPTTGKPGVLSRGTVLRTVDGGANWSRLFLDSPWSLLAISFGDSSNAIAGGAYDDFGMPADRSGVILRSTNGGTTWSVALSTNVRLNGVSSIGRDKATAVGNNGSIFRTSDGGITWTAPQSGTQERLSAVWFVNADYGLAVGDSGTMLRTDNGGAEWIPEPQITTKALYAISFSDPNRGTVVGDGGTILRTTPGNILVSVTENRSYSLPREFALAQNYPNPFNPLTNFEIRISKFEFVSLKVFDILGREVATLIDEERRPGTYRVVWDASRFPSGVYFYRLQVSNASAGSARAYVETRKMILLK